MPFLPQDRIEVVYGICERRALGLIDFRAVKALVVGADVAEVFYVAVALAQAGVRDSSRGPVRLVIKELGSAVLWRISAIRAGNRRTRMRRLASARS